MDEKIFFEGGEPAINSDDLQRNPLANRAGLFGIMAGFAKELNVNFIVSGCEYTITPGVEITITAGYIFLNGELLQVEAQTVAETHGTNVYYFEKSITYDPDGEKIYNNLITRQTWVKNRGVLVNSPTSTVPANKLDVRGESIGSKINRQLFFNFQEIANIDKILDLNTSFIRLDISGPGTSIITIPNYNNPLYFNNYIYFNTFQSDPNAPFSTYEIRDEDGNLIHTINKITVLTLINDKTAWNIHQLVQSDSNLGAAIRITELDLPAWDMKGTASILFPHGKTNKEEILFITCKILNDAETEFYNLTNDDGGQIKWDDTNIILTRSGSLFNSTNFDRIDFSRGKLQIYIRNI